jgi:hypothetical protein
MASDHVDSACTLDICRQSGWASSGQVDFVEFAVTFALGKFFNYLHFQPQLFF